MTRRRRTTLLGMFTLLVACNALFWLYNAGVRIKGERHHIHEAAQAVVDELTARGMLEMPEDDSEEWKLYWDAFAGPIQSHIDPYRSSAIYPPLFNMAALLALAIAVFVPGRRMVQEPLAVDYEWVHSEEEL